MILVFILVSLFVQWCIPQQCQIRNTKTWARKKLPVNDSSPLYTAEDTTFGILFQKCYHYCKENQQCIGFEVCTVAEDLFRCNTCCKWKKRKNNGSLEESSTCTYYEKNIELGPNLALKKTATFSSQWDSDHSASNSVDGITECYYIYNEIANVAASSYSTNSWLRIDLESSYNIRMVVVYARTNNRHQTDSILIVVNDDNSNYTCGGEYTGPTAAFDVILFPCAVVSRGSSITILKTVSGVLGLCEVEIFGYQ